MPSRTPERLAHGRFTPAEEAALYTMANIVFPNGAPRGPISPEEARAAAARAGYVRMDDFWLEEAEVETPLGKADTQHSNVTATASSASTHHILTCLHPTLLTQTSAGWLGASLITLCYLAPRPPPRLVTKATFKPLAPPPLRVLAVPAAPTPWTAERVTMKRRGLAPRSHVRVLPVSAAGVGSSDQWSVPTGVYCAVLEPVGHSVLALQSRP